MSGFDDLPQIRERKWSGGGLVRAPRTLARAQRLAKFCKTMDGVKAVKIVKETRWVVLWRTK